MIPIVVYARISRDNTHLVCTMKLLFKKALDWGDARQFLTAAALTIMWRQNHHKLEPPKRLSIASVNRKTLTNKSHSPVLRDKLAQGHKHHTESVTAVTR